MLKIGDYIKVKDCVWDDKYYKIHWARPVPSGPVFWISPVGIHKVMLEGCGWQFKQEDVEWLWTDVDLTELE